MGTFANGVADKDLEQLMSLFGVLADKTRLNILMILGRGERNVKSLCAELGLPQPTVSHHLGLLRTNNIIGSRRNGKQVIYGMNGQIDLSQSDALEIHVENYTLRIGRRGK